MRRLLVTAIVVALAISTTPAQVLRLDSLASPSLGRTMRIMICQPAKHSGRLPLLILLHGYGGNERAWSQETHLTTYVGSTPLLVAMPDGENSWYANHPLPSGERYEDYILKDVIAFLARRYNADTTRMAIAGLSMGGYGALALGLRTPGQFRFIGALSGSLDIPEGIPDLEKHGREGLKPSLLKAFGAEHSPQWDRYNLFLLAAAMPADRAPYLYLANGIQDEFAARLGLYRAFADTVRAHHLAYEYHEEPGRHAWDYWDRELNIMLNWLRTHGFMEPMMSAASTH